MAHNKQWTHARRKLLVSTRLRHEPDFIAGKEKRGTIWQTIFKEIKEADAAFPFTRDEIKRSFLNIMGTYKRIRRRSIPGEPATTWEFYDVIDKTFGSRINTYVPEEMTEYSSEDFATIWGDSPLPVETYEEERKPEVIDFLDKEPVNDDEILNKILKFECEFEVGNGNIPLSLETDEEERNSSTTRKRKATETMDFLDREPVDDDEILNKILKFECEFEVGKGNSHLPVESDEEQKKPSTARQRKTNEMMDFLKKESMKDNEILDKLLKLESQISENEKTKASLPDETDEEETMPETTRKRKKNEIIDFLEKESMKDNEILNRMLNLESKRLKVETAKLIEWRAIRALFEKSAREHTNKINHRFK